MRRLEGRVAVVTGAAQGIGRATAERMLAEGARVLLADRHETVPGGHRGRDLRPRRVGDDRVGATGMGRGRYPVQRARAKTGSLPEFPACRSSLGQSGGVWWLQT